MGPRLQKINPETFELVKYYETVSDVMKENPNIKRPTLNKAIVENRVYYNYRWLFVERSMDPTIIHEISPTKESIHKEMGYIAKINQEKTEILNVYIDHPFFFYYVEAKVRTPKTTSNLLFYNKFSCGRFGV